MPFFNREGDIRRIKAVLSGEPNLVWFVYGPINSGKTALLMRVFEELSDEYQVFYINFRWREVSKVEDLLQVLFEVRHGEGKQVVKEIIREVLKSGASAIGKLKGIPIPERVFEYLFGSEKKVEDAFRYMEVVFEEIAEEGFRPVLVLDEMQTIKEIMNEAGRPILSGLFNFLVGMTKEKHLCHALCATSDCLFIEDVYANARLEGRAEYVLVDDLNKEEAFEVYEGFRFEEKDLVWDYIGGKLGDMIRLFERKKQGYPEREILGRMLRDEMSRLEDLLERISTGRRKFYFEGAEISIEISKVEKALRVFKEKEEVLKREVDPIYRNYLVYENILFYNPKEGTVRPQSRLLWRTIRKLVNDG